MSCVEDSPGSATARVEDVPETSRAVEVQAKLGEALVCLDVYPEMPVQDEQLSNGVLHALPPQGALKVQSPLAEETPSSTGELRRISSSMSFTKSKHFLAIVWTVVLLFGVAWFSLLVVWVSMPRAGSSTAPVFLVISVAFAAYFVKAVDMGDAMILGRRVPVVRYADWIITTPIMLYELCAIGEAKSHVVIMVIGCDLLMLGFGIIAAMISQTEHRVKWVFFFASCFFYVLMLLALHDKVANDTALETSDEVQALFTQVEVLTIVTWTCYPIVVGLGRAHLGRISKYTEDVLLIVLDVVSKIGMESLIIRTCVVRGGPCHAGDYD